MSRIIKSVKTLEKLIGETVHVVTYDGYTCDAKVEKVSSGEKGVVLVTEDKRVLQDTYWWPTGKASKCAGHLVRNKNELTIELKSVTTRGHKQVSKASTTVLGLDKLIESIGHYCKLIDGSKGFIAKSCYSSCVCVIHNSEKVDGWNLAKRKEEVEEISDSFRKQFKYGWHVNSPYTANQVKVVEILDNPACKTAESKKTILDMTLREVLEKLNEFIKC